MPYQEKSFIRDGREPIPNEISTSYVMQANKGKNTKPEILLRKYLWKQGLRGYRIHSKKIIGHPDIAFPRAQIAIFVNGCFWHRCSLCNPPTPKTHKLFWNKKFQNNIERDKKINRLLFEKGWKSITIWECQIKNNIAECGEKILLEIQKEGYEKRI